MATIEEYLSHIYANVLEPSQATALQECLRLDSPGAVRVHQVAEALKVINAPGVAMSALYSFCEKHKIPIDWLDDSQEAAGSGVANQRPEIAGGTNSTIPELSDPEAVRTNMCTEDTLSTDARLPVGRPPQAAFNADFQKEKEVAPEVSVHAQVTQDDSDGPISYLRYLQSTTFGIKRGEAVTDADDFKRNVIGQLEEFIKHKPLALGLFVPFVSPKGFQQKEDLPRLVDGAEKLKKAFSRLGHAVFELKPYVNLESWQLKAALEGIAAVASKFPASFQQICIYFTGHGGENVVYTPDGEVPLTHFTESFCSAPASKDSLLKVFIFDVCNFGTKNIHQDSITAVDTICVFASIPGNRAFAMKNSCGLLTSHLAKAIQTIDKPFSLVVADAAKEIQKEIDEHPEYGVVEPAECQAVVYQASRPLNLLEERRKAMTPKMQIVESLPTAVNVKVSFPASASHFNPTGCCVHVQCEGRNDIRPLSLPGTDQVCIDGLSPGKDYKLKAVAKYVPNGFPEEEVSSEEQQIRVPVGVIPGIQLGPTRTTVTVAPPPLHQQYNMQSLSVKYWAEDEGEEMARSVDVDVRAGQDQIHLPGKERRKRYKAKAVAMYTLPPGSAVSSPVLTLPKEDTRIKLFWNHHKKSCICVLVALLLSLLVFPALSVISAVAYNRLTAEGPVQELGYQGDMIFMGEIDSSKQMQVSVRECDKTHDDYPSVYRVKSRQDNLILHNSTCDYDEPGFSVRDRSCIVLPDYGEAPPPYLMRKSEISAYICLSSVNHSTESYPAYSYISKAQDVEDLKHCRSDAINQRPYKTLQIGSNNRSVCTWLNFTVKESDSPGYYKPYLVLPGQVYIRYNISFHRKYLNRTDYKEDLICHEISESDSCSVSIPGILNHEHYSVLVYIPDYESSSFGNNTLSDIQPTTHACMHGEKFLEVAAIIGGICYSGLLLLTIVFILCLFFIHNVVNCYRRCNYDRL